MPSQSPEKPRDQPPNLSSVSRPSPRKHKAHGSGSSNREQLLSPKKKQTKQPLHIRMNLTETQMDKITDA